MKDLKNKNIYELIKIIDDKLNLLYTHNKNYTKEQYFNIIDLIDTITELKERI